MRSYINSMLGFALIAALLVTLAACASAPATPATQQQPAPAAQQPAPTAQQQAPAAKAPAPAAAAPGGSVTVGLHQEPDRFWDPITGLTVAQEVTRLVNDVLLRIDDKLAYVPALVSEVPSVQNGGISADGLTYTFKLRKEAKWHDGKPFTAKDVKFTLDTILNPDSAVRGRVGFNQIDTITLPDDNTVVIKFKTIDAGFLDRLAITPILPEHVLGSVPVKDLANHEWFRAPKPGLGPFKFVEWVKGDHITVEKNPDYYLGAPNLDRIVLKIITDANTLTNQLETGEVDIRFRTLNDQIPVFQKMNTVSIVSTNSTSPWLIWVNNTAPGLKEKEVRQALQYGFDKKGLTGTVLKGLVQPAYGLIPPSSWAHNPDVARYEFDPAKAKALLEQAGWKPGADGVRAKDGQRLSFEILNIAGEQERVQILSFIQNQWKDIGVEAKLKNVDVATMWGNAMPKGEYQMGYSYSGRLADPQDMAQHYLCPERKPTTNWGRYCNPKVDELLIQANATTDQARRAEGFKQAQTIVADDATYIYLGWRADHTIVNKRLQGYKPATGYLEMWNAREWSVAK